MLRKPTILILFESARPHAWHNACTTTNVNHWDCSATTNVLPFEAKPNGTKETLWDLVLGLNPHHAFPRANKRDSKES